MPANSTETFDLAGLREDLIDAIYNVDPTETPFISNTGKTKADATLHEWQTDTLAAPAANAVEEGAVAAFTTAAATVRLNNRTQIMTKTVIISGTLEAVNKAGRKREMAYQLIKRGQELKRDMEHGLLGLAGVKVAGANGTPPKFGAMLAWLATNSSAGAGGTEPSPVDGSDARGDGTPRALTEVLFGNVIDNIYASGGNPNMVLATPKQKRVITGFDGNAGQVQHINDDKRVINAVDMYVSDYGVLQIVPHRTIMMRERDVWILQTDMFKLAFLRDMHTNDIAKVGDAERKQLLVEFTLVSKNEKASGIVADLS